MQESKPVNPAPQQPTPAPTPAPSVSEAEAKAFIYMKESTNRLEAENGSGCIGLGHDCNGQLHIQCPNWKTDRACQENFWESYMKRRYGSWVKARAHWLARVPIKGRDVGNWW